MFRKRLFALQRLTAISSSTGQILIGLFLTACVAIVLHLHLEDKNNMDHTENHRRHSRLAAISKYFLLE